MSAIGKTALSISIGQLFLLHFDLIKYLAVYFIVAPQNLVIDPPVSKCDRISCRDLLIYLDAPIQKKAISLFHFALKEGESLFLGTSESIGQSNDLFDTLSKKWRIFKRIGIDQHNRVEFPIIVTDREHRSFDTC